MPDAPYAIEGEFTVLFVSQHRGSGCGDYRILVGSFRRID